MSKTQRYVAKRLEAGRYEYRGRIIIKRTENENCVRKTGVGNMGVGYSRKVTYWESDDDDGCQCDTLRDIKREIDAREEFAVFQKDFYSINPGAKFSDLADAFRAFRASQVEL